MLIKIHKTQDYVRFLNKTIIEENGLIGSTFYSYKCGKFIVEEYVGKNKNNDSLYKIRFLETNETYNIRKDLIIHGNIKDYMYNTVYDIACLGREFPKIHKKDKELCNTLRKRWNNLIHKIYDPGCSAYKFYGELGVIIDESWLNFSVYYSDITSLPDFDKDEFVNNDINIDKDLKQLHLPIGERVYSKDTVSLISRKDNQLIIDHDKRVSKMAKLFVAIDKDNNEWLCKNVEKFSRDRDVKSPSSICSILNGRVPPHHTVKGYRFRYPTPEEQELIDKGLLSVGDKISDTKT